MSLINASVVFISVRLHVYAVAQMRENLSIDRIKKIDIGNMFNDYDIDVFSIYIDMPSNFRQ